MLNFCIFYIVKTLNIMKSSASITFLYILLLMSFFSAESQVTLAEWNPSCDGNGASTVEAGITAGNVSIVSATCAVECFSGNAEGAVRGKLGDDEASFTYEITFSGGEGNLSELNYDIQRSNTGYDSWEVTLDGSSLGNFSKTTTSQSSFILDIIPDEIYLQGETATIVISPSNYQGTNTDCDDNFGGTFRVPVMTFIGEVTLPVELSSFEARNEDGWAKLIWTTASEINNSHFNIEQSTDGLGFVKIGEVKGNGTTNVEQSYSFITTMSESTNDYFRLKQIDYDGAFEYSQVVVLRKENKDFDNITIYRNNSSELIILGAQNAKYSIRDFHGRILLFGNIDDQENIDISLLKEGMYLVSIQGVHGNWTEKIVK